MFTGIVQGMAKVVSIDKKDNFQTHVIELKAPLNQGISIGASVAHNGCCLTVTHVEGDKVSFDLMQETLKLTNLGELEVGSSVNVERAAKFGDEIGGHTMSGHIMDIATVSEIITTPNNKTIWFELAEQHMKYVLAKGFIGLDGCSLTIGEVS